MSELPILYSFRRCPYAMRARLALQYSKIKCILREISLKNKPASLLEISPKATVPVLQLPDGVVIEESLDIMHYALEQNDPEKLSIKHHSLAEDLIFENDSGFVKLLHRYKYFEHYPEETQLAYRIQAEEKFLAKYEVMLKSNKFLLGEKSLADLAILPFIRQFALVDADWFFASKYTNLINWLNSCLQNKPFQDEIMAKHAPWQEGDDVIYFLS